MSLHRLSAGAGYQYLLRHTACGDAERDAVMPLTAYYTASGYPPGRWCGTGLAGLGDGAGLVPGSVVSEEAMAALYGSGRDPLTGAPLGKAYPVFRSAAERIADRSSALPLDLDAVEYDAAVARIVKAETERRTPGAVAGFDMTFTAPKSASVLWALSDPKTQAAVVAAHRAAVDQALAFVEDRALFTRIGARSCAQVPTRGLIAAAFDHWDTRTADPNLHTHVVVANKVQGKDGRWRTVDSRALHHAVVAVSEIYDDLFADALGRELSVGWSWRPRGSRRTPAFEVDGIDDILLAEFSTRSSHIDVEMKSSVADFYATHGRGPNRVEILRLRQQATRATRPAKTAHPLGQLLRTWCDRATRLTGHSPEYLTHQALPDEAVGRRGRSPALRADQVSEALIARLAADSLDEVMIRRSTWTPWNLLAETARSTRGVRMASPADRHALHDRVVDAALAQCASLRPPELFSSPGAYRRTDGTSVFRRPGEELFSHTRVMDAERRLLDANLDMTAPTTLVDTARRIATAPQQAHRGAAPLLLARDQIDAVIEIATSGRRLDVLVGPAGTGKTTTLRALRAAWETAHGHGSVIGLAPSATAAAELAAALNIKCENTAKWLHETTGPAGLGRGAILEELARRRSHTAACGDQAAVRRIDTAIKSLNRDQADWTLHPGHLIIVDEASLAGTFALDDLTAQVTAAGAKLVLVGDHRQLSAVDAGGAFGLLAETGNARELRSLWRFNNRWEANATRLLREGDQTALDAYEAAGRVAVGTAESMLETAYAGWQNHQESGESSILVAADAHTVEALNTRAHDDRVTAGSVAPEGVPAVGGVTVGVGDRVVTRHNDRRIPVPGRGYVQNGALWDVIATHPDGSLSIAPADYPRHTTSAADARPGVNLPTDYVREHVELGYATTIHRAQGVTVDHAHVLAAPGMTRESLYVAMTRGRASNRAYVVIDAVDPLCDPLPDPGSVSTGREILERILTASGAERSATQSLRDMQDASASLAALEPIRTTLITDADARRWRRLLPTCGLTEHQVEAIFESSGAGPLLAAFRAAEQDGHPVARLLPSLMASRPLDDPLEPVRDVAAVIRERVLTWLDRAPSVSMSSDAQENQSTGLTGRLGASSRVDPDDVNYQAIMDLDSLIQGRLGSLADLAVGSRPPWTRPLGDPPSAVGDGARWRDSLATIAAYRDLNRITATTPLGGDPSRDNTDRRQRREASHAATLASRISDREGGRIL